MKTRFLQIGGLILCAAGLPLVAGCEEDSEAQVSKVANTKSNLPPASVASVTATNPVVEVEQNAPPPAQVEPAPGSTNQTLPADLKLSPKTLEMVKLAQAGVDESVMLAFVTNSTSMFSLGSEQIVYLNDLGVPSEVLTAMLEHDRSLREGGAVVASAGPPSAASAETVAPTAPPSEPPPAAATEYVAPPPENVTYNYFYSSLSPYGTWVDVDGYGSCWQPSIVVLNSGWRPYCDGGRWIYTGYGWYWQSDYSWGWAPFHYGRWFCHPRWGWCWRPDYTWGPAWVSWRYTDQYCGWAPLPPAACFTAGIGFSYYGSSVGFGFGFGLGWNSYAFVPWRHFRDHRPYRHCVAHHEVRTIYEHSRVANNIVTGRNNIIINNGIGVGRVREYTHQEVRPVPVREVAVTERDHRRLGDRLDRGGRELVIQRLRVPDNVHASAPSPRTSAPFAPRIGSAAVSSAGHTSGRERNRSSVDVSPRQDRRGSEFAGSPTPRPSTALTTPPTPAPSVPSKLETMPPKREVFPPGSVVWNGRRDTSGSEAGNSSRDRTIEERPRANMTTVWPRQEQSRGRISVVQSPPTSTAQPRSAPITPRVIEVPQSRTYNQPAPSAPRIVYPERPRSYSAPSAPRSEPRVSSPVFNMPARPSYSPPPATRSEPNFVPRSAPSAPPSYSAPSRSESRPAPSSSGGSRGSDQGRGHGRGR